MKYYIYKHGEKIVGHIQTNKNMPAPAVAVSEEEFRNLGLYRNVPEKPSAAEGEIAELKAQLVSTDYKIIKCSEAQLVGEELPYDIVVLHSERQALRDRINELERGATAGCE